MLFSGFIICIGLALYLFVNFPIIAAHCSAVLRFCQSIDWDPENNQYRVYFGVNQRSESDLECGVLPDDEVDSVQSERGDSEPEPELVGLEPTQSTRSLLTDPGLPSEPIPDSFSITSSQLQLDLAQLDSYLDSVPQASPQPHPVDSSVSVPQPDPLPVQTGLGPVEPLLVIAPGSEPEPPAPPSARAHSPCTTCDTHPFHYFSLTRLLNAPVNSVRPLSPPRPVPVQAAQTIGTQTTGIQTTRARFIRVQPPAQNIQTSFVPPPMRGQATRPRRRIRGRRNYLSLIHI